MAIDTYANLKTSIANYLNRSDLTAFLGDFITLTEARLNRELRVREMVNTDTTTTTVSGTQSYALPTGYIEATTVIYQSDPYCTLKFINNSDFYKMPSGVVNYHEDGNICVHNRHIYEKEGCKFAPINVAVRFSQENRIPECEGITPFGFHYRLPPGVTLKS